ncbi:MAG: anhydro-N-acetylmuramic acid kinase [Candidatus Hydrogenedens sp.]|nr:anhydro-N-acetylmuramic acid kinase [Candidatus Hydrogenedens sp.]
MDLNALREKPMRFLIGLMTGTSGDGIDGVVVRIKGTGPGLAIKLIAHASFPYTPLFRTRLINEHLSVREVCSLNFEMGELLADAAKEMVKLAEAQGVTVDAIASHGQTVAHLPPPQYDKYGTLQIGAPAVIAERTGLPVISDFRSRDMAAGGQGAPLVPYGDWMIWRDRKGERNILGLNLGGIANFTVITPKLNDVMAFDTGPCNMAIDGAVRLLSRGAEQMDTNGEMSDKGIVVDEFYEYLLNQPYFDKVPPKSTGREDFGEEVYLRDAITARSKQHAQEDLVATVAAAVADSILQAYERFIKPEHEVSHVIVGGGGTHNKGLMKRLEKGFGDIPLYACSQFGIPSQAREAIAFAILGNETLCGTPSNVPQATGASKRVVLGSITLP